MSADTGIETNCIHGLLQKETAATIWIFRKINWPTPAARGRLQYSYTAVEAGREATPSAPSCLFFLPFSDSGRRDKFQTMSVRVKIGKVLQRPTSLALDSVQDG